MTKKERAARRAANEAALGMTLSAEPWQHEVIGLPSEGEAVYRCPERAARDDLGPGYYVLDHTLRHKPVGLHNYDGAPS